MQFRSLTVCLLTLMLVSTATLRSVSARDEVAPSPQRCLATWPELGMTQDEVKRLTAAGIAAREPAGEIPSQESVSNIISALSRAARGGSSRAQRLLGQYVFSYWMTDEMFWPEQREVAITALAMLRVYALREAEAGKTSSSALVRALAQTPPMFKELPLPPPAAWLKPSLERAQRWLKCAQAVKKQQRAKEELKRGLEQRLRQASSPVP